MAKIILQCINCGEDMEALRANKKYCSRACENQARQKRLQEGKSDLDKKCIICGNSFTVVDKSANNRKYCYDCLPQGITARRGYYIQLIKQKYGGECKICGYNKCIAALEFHHLDESEKEGLVSNANGTVEKSLIEAEKCILLCSNCHREVHAGLSLSYDDLKRLKGE